MRSHFHYTKGLLFPVLVIICIFIFQYFSLYFVNYKFQSRPEETRNFLLDVSIIFLLNTIGFILLWFYGRFKEKKSIRSLLDSNRDRLDYLSAVDKLKDKLLSLNSIPSICTTITSFIENTFHVNWSKLYLWDEEQGVFRPHPSSELIDDHFYVYDPFLLWLADNDGIFSPDNFESFEELEKIKHPARDFFSKSDASLVIPLTMNNSLLGILCISSKISELNFHRIELERFYDIKSISVMSLSNAIFYSRLTQLTENLETKVKERTRALEEAQSQLVMSEKMASLGVMVAGIAHEINTPAGVINGSADNLEGNMQHVFKNISTLCKFFQDEELKIKVEKLLDTILNSENKTIIDNRSKFKFKKALKEKHAEKDLKDPLLTEICNFIIEKKLLEIDELLVDIVKVGGNEVFQYIANVTSMQRNQKNIKYSIKNIVRIVRALKYYSHLDQASFAEADLVEGIENTLIILNSQIKHGIKVIRSYDNIPRVFCNIDELNQVWTNVIQNAIHAMKGEGNLEIKTYLLDELFVCVEVIDTGCGIPIEIQDRIWDPFFTTKDQGEGSGLGLGIVKGIIEKHKGKIEFSSETGKTSFRIVLPISVKNS
ncbi:MAG: histidine kinase [Leptospiraceae bacterium]|nr:histidine kinase [Leptospiraceae bacterium]